MGGETDSAQSGNGFLDLPFAEQFLVWAARIWLGAMAHGGRCVPAVLQEGLCAAGVPEAWEPLDVLLKTLCRHAHRTPDFHGARCLCIGRDERMLIHAMAAAQRGDAPSVRRALQTLLPSDVVDGAAARLEELGHVFLCAGLRFGAATCRTARALARRATVSPHYVIASRSIH